MIKALRRSLVFFCLGAVALMAVPPAVAQKSVPPPQETLQAAVPKDIHTRAKLHTELGSLYFQNGNLIVALEELTIAISINPNYAPAYSTRGVVLYYVKEFESAEKDFRRAIELDERDPEISNNFGWFLCQIGKEKEAIAYFQRALKSTLYQTPEAAYLNAGTCYIKLGDLDSAEDSIRRSLRIVPENWQALFQLANISYKRGNYDGAREHLKNVVRLTDPGPDVLWLFLRVERRLGDRSAEGSLLSQLRRKFPDSPEYLAYLRGNFE